MSSLDKDKDLETTVMLAQYRECYKCFRHHNNVIWQIPFIMSVIVGSLDIGIFRYLYNNTSLVVVILALLIPLLISASLLVAVVKHHLYYEIELETLDEIEKKLKKKLGEDICLILRRYPFDYSIYKCEEYYACKYNESFNQMQSKNVTTNKTKINEIKSAVNKLSRYIIDKIEMKSSHVMLIFSCFLIFIVQVFLILYCIFKTI